MQVINQDGKSYKIEDEGVIYINDEKVQVPKEWFLGGTSLVTDEKGVYINGYEYKDGEFKRTLKAIWKCLF